MNSTNAAAPLREDGVPSAARRRAGLVAAIAGLVLLPWFWVTEAVAGFDPVSPPLGAPDQEFIDFYVANVSRIPLSATLYVGQWVIMLVLVVGVALAACRRLDLTTILAITLAGAATAIYVGAEGVRVWPVLAASMNAERLRDDLDPTLAQGALLSRDGLHAPAGVLLGVAMLLIAWLLARSDVWGHLVMAGLAVLAGGLALSSILVGPEGVGPGYVFLLWGPVTSILLLIGRWRARKHPPSSGDAAPPLH